MYPSITKKIVKRSLEWASEYNEALDENKKDIILISCGSVVVQDHSVFKKRQKGEEYILFEVTMGS